MMRTTIWVIFFAIVIDVAINNIFTIPYPYARGEQLANYFEYGRSTESKVVRAVADDDRNASISAKIGWFKSNEDNPSLPGSGSGTNIYVYGMSFSNHIGELLLKIDPSLNVKLFSGPGAPLNHSYAYYETTRPHNKGDIVILGILASSLPRMNSLTHMTSSFESPSPHFYPRYHIDDKNRIVKYEMDINSLSELRNTIGDAESWKQAKQYLAAQDSFYDSVIFEHDLLDYSVYLRLVKRAWGQRSLTRNVERYHDQTGFKNEERLVELARGLVSEFADSVRADGAIPYVMLFNDRGYSDHLYQVLKPVLASKDIDYYSTHQKYPASNLDNFIADGHFKPEIDVEITIDVHQHLERIKDSNN